MKTSGRPLIFVTNDDGYQAAGIAALIRLAAEFGDVVAVAPNESYSGMSHSITMHRPLFVNTVSCEPGIEIYSCTGTPVDCVKIGFDEVLKDRVPDLVLSGINHGSNANVSVIYSGTMGVAMEGCMKYIPSIAFSSCDYDEEADLYPLAEWVKRIVHMALDEGLPRGTCLNVNFPAAPPFKGIRFCRIMPSLRRQRLHFLDQLSYCLTLRDQGIENIRRTILPASTKQIICGHMEVIR